MRDTNDPWNQAKVLSLLGQPTSQNHLMMLRVPCRTSQHMLKARLIPGMRDILHIDPFCFRSGCADLLKALEGVRYLKANRLYAALRSIKGLKRESHRLHSQLRGLGRVQDLHGPLKDVRRALRYALRSTAESTKVHTALQKAESKTSACLGLLDDLGPVSALNG